MKDRSTMTRVDEIMTLTAIRTRLCDILHGVEIDQNMGICRNVQEGSFERIIEEHYISTNNEVVMYKSRNFVWDWLKKSFAEFGYNTTYPVEHEILNGDTFNSFVKLCIKLRYRLNWSDHSSGWYHANQKRKFGYGTIHGRFRMALLEKLIEKVEKDINNIKSIDEE